VGSLAAACRIFTTSLSGIPILSYLIASLGIVGSSSRAEVTNSNLYKNRSIEQSLDVPERATVGFLSPQMAPVQCRILWLCQ
jgi:hypothetical protein